MGKLILTDFDQTLFDTGKLVKEMTKIFRDYGGLDFCKTMPQDSNGNYSLVRHIELVLPRAKRRRTIRRLDQLLSRSSDFLFDDAVDFLQQCSVFFLVLITRGEKAYQSRKVFPALRTCRHLFKQIIICEDEKVKHILDLFKRVGPDEIFFVDDKINEFEPVKKAIPAIKTILISRIGLTKVDPGSDFAVSNLVEAAKIILSTGG